MAVAAPLRRVRQDRVVAGVLAGIARHFDLDVSLLRVVYVIATICTAFVGVVIYLMAWVVIPEEPGGDLQG
jgi:phage shock protein C